MSGTSYVPRELTFVIQLGSTNFGSTGQNTLTLSGLRASATVVQAGAFAMVEADVQIYGMLLSDMNAVSTLGTPLAALKYNNRLTVLAGDAQNGFTEIFYGAIITAYFDGDAAPDIAFVIQAQTAIDAALKPAAPSSYAGAANVASIMQGFASTLNVGFQNYGVSSVLANPYFPGTIWDQIKSCARAANINFSYANKVLSIWPPGGKVGTATPTISKDSGLVGYPSFTQNGLAFRCLFNPGLQFGGLVTIQSILSGACGTWAINALSHTLECLTPDGAWFSDVLAVNPAVSNFG